MSGVILKEKEENSIQFSKRIFEVISKSGLKNHEIQAALGISEKTLYNWKSGTSLPSMSQVAKLAEILNVSIDTLYNNSSNINTEQPVKSYNPEKSIKSEIDFLKIELQKKEQQIQTQLDIINKLTEHMITESKRGVGSHEDQSGCQVKCNDSPH
jgi:transcriptional regulator with XRE-family HTH domain